MLLILGVGNNKGFTVRSYMVRESLIHNFGHHNIKRVRQEEAIFTEKFALLLIKIML